MVPGRTVCVCLKPLGPIPRSSVRWSPHSGHGSGLYWQYRTVKNFLLWHRYAEPCLPCCAARRLPRPRPTLIAGWPGGDQRLRRALHDGFRPLRQHRRPQHHRRFLLHANVATVQLHGAFLSTLGFIGSSSLLSSRIGVGTSYHVRAPHASASLLPPGGQRGDRVVRLKDSRLNDAPGFLVDPFLGKGNLRLGKDRIKKSVSKLSEEIWDGRMDPFLEPEEIGQLARPISCGCF